VKVHPDGTVWICLATKLVPQLLHGCQQLLCIQMVKDSLRGMRTTTRSVWCPSFWAHAQGLGTIGESLKTYV
jgi:hypothetical protein